MGGGGPSNSNGSQTQTFKPWKAQAPFLKDIYSRASSLSNVPLEWFPGSHVAGRDPSTEAGLSMIEQRAADGSPIGAGAEGLAAATLRGDFLNSNPYLDETFNRGADAVTRKFNQAVMPQIDTRFGGAGRIGSGAHAAAQGEAARALAGELGGLANEVYGGNYTRERSNQMSTLGMSPALQAAGYMDADRLREAGEARESYSQRVLDDQIAGFEFGQEEPWQRLARFAGLVGGPVGGSSTSTSQRASTSWDDILMKLL